jgi:CheY-like chemotaxis protein
MKKVLVVDDNEEILNVISIVLEMNEFSVRCANNGDVVHDLAESYRPDVIILDIMLGGVDGRDICNQLKKHPNTNHIPIVMISASHNLKQARENDCPADAFVSKPFDIDHLATVVAGIAN